MKTGFQAVVVWLLVLVVFGALVFLPAWTFNYWQAWVFIAVFTISWSVPGLYVSLKDPAALQRRMRGGPGAETRTVQKFASSVMLLSMLAVIVFSAFAHRFGEAPVSMIISVIGDALVVVGMSLICLVVIQNRYAAANITIEEGQKLTTTGLYGLVRHPMYMGVLIMMTGIPLALGSWWGLVILIPDAIAIVLRIIDEEKLLKQELDGYREYTQNVHYRLIPFIW